MRERGFQRELVGCLEAAQAADASAKERQVLKGKCDALGLQASRLRHDALANLPSKTRVEVPYLWV